MKPLTPDDLAHQVDVIREALGQIVEEYRWLYDAQYDTAVGETAHVATSNIGDPTHAAAAAGWNQQARHVTERVTGRIVKMARDAQVGAAGIKQFGERDPRRPGIEHDPGEPMVTADELAIARAMREKRIQAGGGYGRS